MLPTLMRTSNLKQGLSRYNAKSHRKSYSTFNRNNPKLTDEQLMRDYWKSLTTYRSGYGKGDSRSEADRQTKVLDHYITQMGKHFGGTNLNDVMRSLGMGIGMGLTIGNHMSRLPPHQFGARALDIPPRMENVAPITPPPPNQNLERREPVRYIQTDFTQNPLFMNKWQEEIQLNHAMSQSMQPKFKFRPIGRQKKPVESVGNKRTETPLEREQDQVQRRKFEELDVDEFINKGLFNEDDDDDDDNLGMGSEGIID